jgi:hypothetical protein
MPTCLSCNSTHLVVFGYCERCRQPPEDPEWAVARRGETAEQKRRRTARQTPEQKAYTRAYQKEWRERKKAEIAAQAAAKRAQLLESDVEGMP